MEKRFWVYMLASQKQGTLYIGVTSDLIKRIWEHKNKVVEGFTEKYDVHNLVWFEDHATADAAIRKEKRLKKYERQWKINLIEEKNPEWVCLYDEICK
ncbi:GIY-YIG nuclease family protein [Micavibrio aeruginosavorus]|uniref:GIY-YIG catalytic domain protein n=1 Tax=Micavibrio aeruginosavorus (strain ARL-13) TaxID=856793 RepID=G2KN77_MICAA|nr:GIY-YIG nuclease family protein [Micavibrio aeruginosavorus]AEP09410.1 GIY-YIG catalytic domain protein [Micavibrio aeruginosavorus ARL-13]